MEIVCTPDIKLEPIEDRQVATINALPEKSKEIYVTTYASFKKWKLNNTINETTQSVMLLYFQDLAVKYKPTSLWTIYSMLKSTINLNENINIETFHKLQDFLKEKSESFQPKQAKVFSPDDIKRFLNDSPDSQYLAIKVALIMGVVGACHSIEMYKMKMCDIKDLDSALIVNIPGVKARKGRKFTITDSFYNICKKYLSGRTQQTRTFVFHQYRNGRLMIPRIGKNNFIIMGRNIAKYLKLDEPDTYSGHSFRKSAGTVFVDEAGDLTALRRFGRRNKYTPNPPNLASTPKIVEEQQVPATSECKDSPKSESIQMEPFNVEKKSFTFNFNINDRGDNIRMYPYMIFQNCSITINNTGHISQR